MSQHNSPQLLGGCELKRRRLSETNTGRSRETFILGQLSVKSMVLLFQRVPDGCALSNGCHCGTMVQSHTSGSHVVIVQGKQAPSHPALSEQSFCGGLARCHGMSPLHHPLPHGVLGGRCTAGPTPRSVSGPRGGDDPSPGIPSFSITALVKSAGKVQGRQEEV